MKKDGKKALFVGIILVAVFAAWTTLIQIVDVQPIGPNETDIGFASFNGRFHQLTGVHMAIYIVTDWLGLIPIFVCMIFGGIGFAQLVKRRSLFKVDCDLIFLGIYYALVMFSYFAFEMIPINYRPVLIEGRLEASYPSSTTLLVLSVMPTLVWQAKNRVKNIAVQKAIGIFAGIFSGFMVMGRLISGVHWFTDIVGSVMLSAGLFCIYKAAVLICYKEEK